MLNDPYSNQQMRFHRTDPTGRINRLQEDNGPDMYWIKTIVLILVGACILVGAAAIRLI